MTRKKDGTWKPGASGNPSGRPAGTGEVAKLRKSIEEHVPEIISQLVKNAKAGDAQSARLLLERVIAPIRAIEMPVELLLPESEGLTAQGLAIVQQVSEGRLSPSQGAALLSGLGNLARVKEVEELEARIEALERSQEERH